MKRFLAVVLAVGMMASLAAVAWAYAFSSVSQVYELTNMCEIEGNEYRYEVDISRYLETHAVTDEEKQKIFDSYNAYLSALEDPSKTILVRTGIRNINYTTVSSAYFDICICDTSKLSRSVTSPYIAMTGEYYKLYVKPNSDIKSVSISALSGNAVNSYYSPGFQNGYLFFIQNPVHPPASSSSNSIFEVKDPVNFKLVFTNIDASKSHDLTINYLYPNGTAAADPVTQSFEPGAEYSIPSPEVEGYTPNIPLVTGTMPEEDLTINVIYSMSFYTLTVQYQYADGTKAQEDVVLQYPAGFAYDIPTPEITGYTPDKLKISGAMPGHDLTETVIYTGKPYTLTVNYQYADGSPAAESYQAQYLVGAKYAIPSPAVEGYHPNQTMVTGTMPSRDVTATVTYREDSGGSSGAGGSGAGDDGNTEGEGGGFSGDDPFKIPDVPPWSGNDPFKIPELPGWSGYDPFKIEKSPGWSGYDPFRIGDLPGWSGYDPFEMPESLEGY